MGGALTFEENEPRGTVVRIRLPTPADAADEAATRETATRTDDPPSTPPAVQPGTGRDIDAATDRS
jgi:hypothetical protein